MSDPVVRVRPPLIHDDGDDDMSLDDMLVLTCSECGELSEWEPLSWRPLLQRQAAVHAVEVHYGLVIREGWPFATPPTNAYATVVYDDHNALRRLRRARGRAR